MKLYFLPSNNITTLFKKLSEQGSLFYPIREEKTAHLVKFDGDKVREPDFSAIRTAETVKHMLMPSRDVVAKFPKDKKYEVGTMFLFGIKSCDMRGIDVYDRVFLKSEPVDPLYKERRDKLVIISSDCPEPEDCCFCNLVGLQPYGEQFSDMNVTQLDTGLLCEVFSKKGQDIVDSCRDLFTEPSDDDIKKREKLRKDAVKSLTVINNKEFASDLPERVENADKETIHNARKNCVECFACLHICPTCYCFLLSDYQKGKDVERVRIWDACYYAAYARVGGGANPRSTLDDRFWNRFNCKFNYYKKYEDIYACTGCGRCLRGCSGTIDIREILWKV
jgi:sulfhydrogenase subunit beta (sulfur reductase)